MEVFADVIGLRLASLGSCMFNAVYAQGQLIIMRFKFAAVFLAAVFNDADYPHLLVGKERQYLVIQKIGPSNGRLGSVEFGSHLL